MEIKCITSIREDRGEIVLDILTSDLSCLSLPCSFQPLLDWRKSLSDKRIVELLSRRTVSIIIHNGYIVEISTRLKRATSSLTPNYEKQGKRIDGSSAILSSEATNFTIEQDAPARVENDLHRRQVILTHRRSPVRLQELKTERIRSAQLREEKRSKRRSHRQAEEGGIAYCPYCRKEVQTVIYWQSGRQVRRCTECGYSIGIVR